MRDAWMDVRQALRSLRREPLYATVVVSLLALGIGANATMFAIIDRLLLQGPGHVQKAEQVSRFYLAASDPHVTSTTSRFPYVDFTVLRSATTSFVDVAAYSSSTVRYGTAVEPHNMPVGYASANFFRLLGVQPRAGRFFLPSDDRTDSPEHVVVISDEFWHREFGGDPGVIGRQLTIRKEPYVVIGIAPSQFTGAELAPVDLWMPLSLLGAMGRPASWPTAWSSGWLQIIGRLKPGISREAVSGELTAAHQRAYTGRSPAIASARIFAAPLSADAQGAEGTETTVARWLQAVSVLVLLLACANTSTLLLARAIRRRGDIAMRIALGATGARIVRLVVLEGAILTLGGVVVGAAIGLLGVMTIGRLAFPGVPWTLGSVAGALAAVCCAFGLLTGIVVAGIAALQVRRFDLTSSLSMSGRTTRAQRSPAAVLLTASQAALTVVLVIGAGLYVSSLWRVDQLRLGIHPDHVVVVGFNWPAGLRGSDSLTAEVRRAATLAEALQRVRVLPGVVSAGIAIGLPLGNSFNYPVRADGVDSLTLAQATVSAVSPGYFSTVETQLIAGRPFSVGDHGGTTPVAIVSRHMAATAWPGRDAIGQCLQVEWARCVRVVGIAEDVIRQELHESPPLHYYVPLGQGPNIDPPELLVRSTGSPSRMIRAVRETMRAADPELIFSPYDGTAMADALAEEVRPWRLGANVFGGLGFLGLAIAVFGLYTILARDVETRTPELAVRLALGAQERSIIVHMLWRVGWSLAAGLAMGLIAAWWITSLIQPTLFETSAHDLRIYVAAASVLLGSGIVATVIPVWRALRVDPMLALRAG
ncbi:MAG TPA: ABC transporter permease [Gemmatimonadales bacterium]